jgi:hypothetical protein
MKKRIMRLILSVAIVAAAGWNISQNRSEVELSGLTLENVDALAIGEDAGDCIIANCRWETYQTCNYTCNGTEFRSSNMYNK